MKFDNKIRFNAKEIKDNISVIHRVEDAHIYQPVFHAICNLIENDKTKNTQEAINYILENYVYFEPIEVEITRYRTGTCYIANLTQIPKDVSKALLKREEFVMENKSKLENELEAKVVKLLDSTEIIK